MPPLGVLVNARAGRARRNPRLIYALREIPGAQVAVTRGLDEVVPALEKLREEHCDTLLCVGGDGTVAGTLTPLLESWPLAALPAIALCRGGTVNTLAKSLDVPADTLGLARGLAAGRPRIRSRRPAVSVSADQDEPRHGLAFVNGVGVRFLEMYYNETGLGVTGAASVVARIAASALVGGSVARRAFAPFHAKLTIDGDPIESRPYTIIGGSSVRHIGLGFAPFHSAGSDPERIHFATTDANARQIVAALPGLRSGRPSRALQHHSVKHARIEMSHPEPWSLDADTHPPASRIDVSAGPTLEFVTPEP